MNIKLTTLNRTMKTLDERKLVDSLGEAESTGGRKAVTYDITHQSLYLIGVDLSRTYVKIILTNLKLTALKTETFLLHEQDSAEKTIDAILFLIESMLQQESIPQNQILGIGVGTVGPLDREQGIMLSPHGFLNPDWGDVPLRERIESSLSIPCFIDNGANAAVLAEYLFGIGKDKRSIAYIHCGIGIRSAVIKDGLIIRAMNDQEDAFGNMIMLLPESGCKSSIESVSALGAVVRAQYQECIDAFSRNYHFADTILFSKGGVFRENTIAIGSAAMVMDHCCKAKAM